MKTLKEIVNEIKSIPNFKPSDDMVLDCATRILNTNHMEKESKKEMPIELATDKQKYRLGKLGVNCPKDLTKKEAIQLIKEHLEV